MAGGYHKQVLI